MSVASEAPARDRTTAPTRLRHPQRPSNGRTLNWNSTGRLPGGKPAGAAAAAGSLAGRHRRPAMGGTQ
jgi:hypothetical protein